MQDSTIAYFAMEMCLDHSIPTFSGGLGVLAGDTLRSAADLSLPMVGVTLLHRTGYFVQRIDSSGNQVESPAVWRPEDFLVALPTTVSIEIEKRRVRVRAWKFTVRGVSGHEVPVFLLDTSLPENNEFDRTLTDNLYGGDNHYRLCQEAVLGMGGAAMLRVLGYDGASVSYHINEGHAALLTLTLLARQLAGRAHGDVTEVDVEAVRRQCIFTTHTPVPAGHDRFPLAMVKKVLGADHAQLLEAARCIDHGELNMTFLALRLSRYSNGVALRHREVSRAMFPLHEIEAVTNGVHATTWTADPFCALFDKHIPEWRRDNFYLRYAVKIPLQEIMEAHARAKADMIDDVARRSGIRLDPRVMTIGFARRATAYKRADLIFTDLERLRTMAAEVGQMQILFGGKAHPNDSGGKDLIRRVFQAAERLGDAVRVIYLENYDMSLARLLVPGVDLWLNNPLKPLEASGTSGMKAALNGVPSLSVLDGWWVEGHVEDVTGWAIGDSVEPAADPRTDANEIYVKLEQKILPLFYGLPGGYAEVMRSAIALNGSFFNTQRMVRQYMHNAYFPARNGADFAAPSLAAVAAAV